MEEEPVTEYLDETIKISDLIKLQKEFFIKGGTLEYSFRLKNLVSLRNEILKREKDIEEALYKDLRKSSFESYMTEIGLVLEEINYHIKNLKKWMKKKKVRTSISQFPARSYIYHEPLGICLIIAPWNYPINLVFMPLIGAISGGNTAVIKPSAYAPNCSNIVREIIESIFCKEYVAVIEGGRKENEKLLEEKFDFIFFTGSISVGKLVMEKASKNLTPIILELGGKSPTIIEKTADLKLAAKRIAFGKILNAGQTCVAPDYVLIDKSVCQLFTKYYVEYIKEFFENDDYKNFPKIINKKHFNRIIKLIDSEKVVFGGEYSEENLIIYPTIIHENDFNSRIMNEEIFGPILPIIEYEDIEECIEYINSKPRPLALYLFTNSSEIEEKIIKRCSYGGGCINDTLVHITNNKMGFGGIGESGIGQYHGEKSFEAFTHPKAIMKKFNWLDLPMRYHPYNEKKSKLVRFFIK